MSSPERGDTASRCRRVCRPDRPYGELALEPNDQRGARSTAVRRALGIGVGVCAGIQSLYTVFPFAAEMGWGDRPHREAGGHGAGGGRCGPVRHVFPQVAGGHGSFADGEGGDKS